MGKVLIMLMDSGRQLCHIPIQAVLDRQMYMKAFSIRCIDVRKDIVREADVFKVELVYCAANVKTAFLKLGVRLNVSPKTNANLHFNYLPISVT